MKILSLDLGDKWVGSAISDELCLTCRPFQTVELKNTADFLKKTIQEQNIQKIIIGYPKTSKGTKSEQTLKIEKQKNELEEKFKKMEFDNLEWILWDERLSSKRAENINTKKIKTSEDKKKSHSIAAAFILQSYIDYLAFSKSL
ncbi:MAG: Holliday junction resolvase RuvX [bacterium]